MAKQGKDEMSIYTKLKNAFDEITRFAFDLSLPKIFVSDISSSLYCEWRKVLELKLGRIETDDMIRGTQIHNEYFAFEQMDEDEINKLIRMGERVEVLLKVGFIWKDYDTGVSVFISGVPDSVVFSNGRIERIIELKTRRRPEIYSSDILQVGIYALCIENMLKGEAHDPIIDDIILDIRVKVVDALPHERSWEFRFGELKHEVLTNMSYVLDFWIGKRDAKIPSSPSICRTCQYRNFCDKKLA